MAETPAPQDDSNEESSKRLPPKQPSVRLSPASGSGSGSIKLKPASSTPEPAKADPKDAERLEVEELAEAEEPTTPTPRKESSILDEIMGAPAQDMEQVDDEWEEEYIEEPEDFDVSMSLDLDEMDDEDEAPDDTLPAKPKIKPVIAGRANLPKISQLTAKNRLTPKDETEEDEEPVSVEGDTKGPEGAPRPTLTPKVPTASKPTLKAKTETSPAAQKPTLQQKSAAVSSAPPAEFIPQREAPKDSGSKVALVIQGVSLAALILLVILLLKELLPLIGG